MNRRSFDCLVASGLVTARFAAMAQQSAQVYRIGFLREHKLPMEDGSYGPMSTQPWPRMAAQIDRIFKGAKPGDLPVEQPTRFKFAINLKTAGTLGLTIPPSLLMRADEVIQ